MSTDIALQDCFMQDKKMDGMLNATPVAMCRECHTRNMQLAAKRTLCEACQAILHLYEHVLSLVSRLLSRFVPFDRILLLHLSFDRN